MYTDVVDMYVTPEMYSDIQRACSLKKVSMSKFMRDAISAYVGKAQKPSLCTKRVKTLVSPAMHADILRVCGEADIYVAEYIRQAMAAYMRGME